MFENGEAFVQKFSRRMRDPDICQCDKAPWVVGSLMAYIAFLALTFSVPPLGEPSAPPPLWALILFIMPMLGIPGLLIVVRILLWPAGDCRTCRQSPRWRKENARRLQEQLHALEND